MPTLAEFRQLVEDMEKGQHPARFPDRATAINALVDEICGVPWNSVEEREKAQGLIRRLEKLKWSEQGEGGMPAVP
jgi:hypothetical protein